MGMRIHVYDLETKNWVEPLSACGITDTGVEIYYEGPDSHRRLAQDMVRIGGVWCAHVGGRFDLLLLLQFLPPIQDMCVVGSTILVAKFQGGLTIRDTYPGWLSSLKSVGKSVGLEKIEVDIDDLENATPAERRAYNLRDCEILALAIGKHQSYSAALGMRHKWTAGSSAVEALKVMEPSAYGVMRQYSQHHERITLARVMARGGRSELAYRGRVSGVYCYDIKSSYPARYFQGDLGLGLVHLSAAKAAKLAHHPQAVLRCIWRTDRYTGYAPAVDDLTYSGSGICQAWLTYEERQQVWEVCTSIEYVEGWAPEVALTFGKTFTDTLFKLKEKGVFFSKVWVNSLHGKLLENPLKESFNGKEPLDFVGEDPDYLPEVELYRYDKLAVDKRGYCEAHYQPLAAAIIYGRARADITKLIRQVEAAGGKFYYTDTDSIHCSLPPEKMPMPLGKELGNLNYEGGPFDAIYCGPKMYYLVNPLTGERKTACKGVRLTDLRRAVKKGGVYMHDKHGTDLQEAFFSDVLAGGATYYKTGVKTFKSGMGAADWAIANNSHRQIKPTGQGRVYPSQGFAPYIHQQG